MTAPPLHASRRTLRSLWQEYRIYPDRLELQSWLLFHTIIVPAVEIESVEVRPSAFRGWRGMTYGIKLDNCDLCRHVLLTRKHGLFCRIGYSPDDPERFAEQCRSIIGGRTGGDSGR